ncbi:hypothetical protein J7E62_05535 [Variovorax paradoxus]|nr:hypothetical protein [Variovorax paradoxus]
MHMNSQQRTEPLPLIPYEMRREPRRGIMRFAVPFLAVMGYYAIGVCTFSVMAAASAPGGGELGQFLWSAGESTSPLALAAALAAARWWV